MKSINTSGNRLARSFANSLLAIGIVIGMSPIELAHAWERPLEKRNPAPEHQLDSLEAQEEDLVLEGPSSPDNDDDIQAGENPGEHNDEADSEDDAAQSDSESTCATSDDAVTIADPLEYTGQLDDIITPKKSSRIAPASLQAVGYAHATLTLYGVPYGSSITRTATATGRPDASDGNGAVSLNSGSGYNPFGSISGSVNGNGLSGGVTVSKSPANGFGTHFSMQLSGQLAEAYNVYYAVHGSGKPYSGAWMGNGENASCENAAIDGVRFFLKAKAYTHTVMARFQNSDGTWSSYSEQQSGSYPYLSTVPAWTRSSDATFKTAASSAYTAGYESNTSYVDVYRQSYTASFDSQGGSSCAYANRAVLCGAPIGELPSPQRSGCTFEGWYDSPTGGNRIYSSSAMPTANKTYYAHWSYPLAFNANGGEGYMPNDQVSLPQSTAQSIPECAYTRPGYRFASWNTNASGSGRSFSPGDGIPGSDLLTQSESESPNGPVKLFAQWEPLQIEFNAPSEIICTLSAQGVVSGPTNGTAKITNLSDTGIAITGIQALSSSEYTFAEQPSLPGEFNLNITPENGSEISLSSFTGSEYKKPDAESDWTIHASSSLVLNNINGSTAGISGISNGQAKLGSVQWLIAANIVTITYDANGGSGARFSQRVNADMTFAPPAPPYQKQGKRFAGWCTSANGSGSRFSAGEPTSFSSDTILYALWENAN